MGEERIGMLGLDAVQGEVFRWKMREVIGDDHIRPAVNGRRQDMAVAGTRQFQRIDQLFKPDNQTIAGVGIHALTGAFKPFASRLGLLRRKFRIHSS
jgi:hypothetical protein